MTVSAVSIDRDSLRSRLMLMLVTLITASVLAVAFAAATAFNRAVEPELVNRTRVIGSIVRSEIQRALDLGIPFEELSGLHRYLSHTLQKFDEVKSIVVTTTAGRRVAGVERPGEPSLLDKTGLTDVIEFHRTSFVLPVLHGNEMVGKISVEINPLFVQTRLRNVFLDVLVLALIAILLALELSLAVTITSFGKPLDRVYRLLREQSAGKFLHRVRPGGVGGLKRAAVRFNDHALDIASRAAAAPTGARHGSGVAIADGRPTLLRLSDFNDIRVALLLFSVATEISTAFLPLFATSVARPEWLSAEAAAAAPLVMYLVALAALSPFGGTMARRMGPRRLFLISVLPTSLALAGMAFSSSIVEITVWRGVIAVFYATATIACQEYAIRAAEGAARARPIGAFVMVVYGGVFCGAALGGLLAGRFGYETALLTGTALAVLAGVLGATSMRGTAGDGDTDSPAAVPVQSDRRGWLNGRFLALLFGVAIPMNIATVTVVWYLTPLALSAAGSDPAEIGRVVMLYYLGIVLFGPTVARLADGRTGPVRLVVLGVFGSAAALLSLFLWSGFWAVTAAVAALGLGHAAIRTPLYALTLNITGGPGPGIDALRLFERIGAVAGLIASALLLGRIDAETTIQGVGLAVLFGAVVYTLVETVQRSRRA